MATQLAFHGKIPEFGRCANNKANSAQEETRQRVLIDIFDL